MRMARVASVLSAGALLSLFQACGSDNNTDNGGGGTQDEAGTSVDPNLFTDASHGCQPRTCGDIGAECGPQADGCGNIIQCGTCTAPAFCGGGGPSKCGSAGGDGGVCTPKTCTDLAAQCGPQGDGCGNVIQCGDCAGLEFCGGGGASKCGFGFLPDGGQVDAGDGGGLCTPTTCAAQGKNCGPMADGCGGLLDCGSCGSGKVCGIKSPNVCAGTLADGGVACTPKTCADFGATCGQLGDGCGGLTAPCGTCSSPQFCGGGGYSKCGAGDAGVNDAGCTGLCQQIPKCDAGTTTLTGTVWGPGGANSAYGPLPVPGAIVYIPNGAVQPFTQGVSCDKCDAAASGNPLVSTTTAADGTFSIKNVPAGSNIPLVVQLGRWRRQVVIPTVQACKTTALSSDLTRLPNSKTDGAGGKADIPLMAISTGDVDALECVLRKMGVSDGEFTSANGSGRIHLYPDNGAIPSGQNPPKASSLYTSQNQLDKYDAVIFACVGDEVKKDPADQGRVKAYADKGGRVFATHYSYVWLFELAPWNGTAVWNVGQGNYKSVTGQIDTTTAKTQQFATWLGVVNALSGTNPPRVSISEARHDVDENVATGAERWITSYQGGQDPPPKMLLHYAFNTPWGAASASQCGRVIYSDFHVTKTGKDGSGGLTFPKECNNNALTAQEKVLAYMLFDLTTCISTPTPPPPPKCTPTNCTALGYKCGQAGDGCGGIIDCGTCVAPATCGGGGTPFQCGGTSASCTPKKCTDLGMDCGQAGDGCGGVLDCGTCTPPAFCGGGGANKCGTNGLGSCTPTTCTAAGAKCGPLGDGCGNLLSCGTCPSTDVCINNQCVTGSCTPITCASAGAECGPLGDGCGGVVDCGTCTSGTCGGSGTPNKCSGIK